MDKGTKVKSGRLQGSGVLPVKLAAELERLSEKGLRRPTNETRKQDREQNSDWLRNSNIIMKKTEEQRKGPLLPSSSFCQSKRSRGGGGVFILTRGLVVEIHFGTLKRQSRMSTTFCNLSDTIGEDAEGVRSALTQQGLASMVRILDGGTDVSKC